MKKMILITLATLLSTAVMADIPNMGKKDKQLEVISTEISGDAAETIYNSIASDEKKEFSLRTSSSYYKVLRSEDGMDQVICHKLTSTLGRKKVSFQCTTESSNTDEELTIYKPSIRLG